MKKILVFAVGLALLQVHSGYAATLTSCSVFRPPGKIFAEFAVEFDSMPDLRRVDAFGNGADQFAFWIDPDPVVPEHGNIHTETFASLIYSERGRIWVEKMVPDPGEFRVSSHRLTLYGAILDVLRPSWTDTTLTFRILLRDLNVAGDFGFICLGANYGVGNAEFRGTSFGEVGPYPAVPEPVAGVAVSLLAAAIGMSLRKRLARPRDWV